MGGAVVECQQQHCGLIPVIQPLGEKIAGVADVAVVKGKLGVS